jgi:hypothetical protein
MHLLKVTNQRRRVDVTLGRPVRMPVGENAGAMAALADGVLRETHFRQMTGWNEDGA